MKNLSLIHIFTLLLKSLRLPHSVLLGIALPIAACSVADPVTDPTASSENSPAVPSALEQPEASSKKPFAQATITGEDLVPLPSSVPEVESLSGLPLGMALPELIIGEGETDADETAEEGSSDTESSEQTSSEQTIVTSALCTAPDSDMRQRMLLLLNEARATARSCGDSQFPATLALRWDEDLASAAGRHSADMASHNFFNHTGSDGSVASVRVSEEGYRWQSVFENIAAGHNTAQEALNAWLDSPGSCQNIMNPAYTDVAVACVDDGESDYQRYWTNILAEPR